MHFHQWISAFKNSGWVLRGKGAAPPLGFASRSAAASAVLATLSQALFFGFGPAVVAGNLHWDTLEAIFWGTEWDFGYVKHPPVVTWLLSAVLRFVGGRGPILAEMALAQASVALSAWYTWRAARLFLDPGGGLNAVLFFLVSPIATVYAIQANHNSLLVPFWAAIQYYGLVYFTRGGSRHALLFGLAAGLGLLTKYESALLVMSLCMAALLDPRWRGRLASARLLVAGGACLLVLTPHLVWLGGHGWPSVERALGPTKMSDLVLVRDSVLNALAGQGLLFALPAVMGVLALRRCGRHLSAFLVPGPHRFLALCLAFLPSAGLLIGALATWQLAKPLWTTPFAPSIALAAALVLADVAPKALVAARPVRFATIASGSIFAGWVLYLVAANAVGDPVLAYAPDTRRLAAAIDSFRGARAGQGRANGLGCLVIDDHQFGPSYLLWTDRMPSVVDLFSPDWQGPDRVAACQRTGGVYVAARRDGATGSIIERQHPPVDWICPEGQNVTVPGAFGPWRPSWRLTLFEVPRAGKACAPTVRPVD